MVVKKYFLLKSPYREHHSGQPHFQPWENHGVYLWEHESNGEHSTRIYKMPVFFDKMHEF